MEGGSSSEIERNIGKAEYYLNDLVSEYTRDCMVVFFTLTPMDGQNKVVSYLNINILSFLLYQ